MKRVDLSFNLAISDKDLGVERMAVSLLACCISNVQKEARQTRLLMVRA